MANVLLPSAERAGVASQVHGLADALARRGHDVTVFAQGPAPIDSRYAVRTLATPARIRRSMRPFAQALHLAMIDFREYDVLHAHGDNYLALRVDAQVRTFHGAASDEMANTNRFGLQQYYRLMTVLEAAGSRVAAYNVGVSQTTRKSIGRIDEVIPCGVDLTRFSHREKTQAPTILFVGALESRKRGSLLVRHFLETVRPAYPNAELWLVSADRIEGPGIVSWGKPSDEELAELYARAWIFCLPSSYEGFGVPYVEAMAAGTPVVATPNLGAKEVLDDGAAGIIVEPNELGRRLNELIANESARRRLAEVGIARARLFAWSTVASRYERAYESVIANPLSLRRRIFRPVASSASVVAPW